MHIGCWSSPIISLHFILINREKNKDEIKNGRGIVKRSSRSEEREKVESLTISPKLVPSCCVIFDLEPLSFVLTNMLIPLQHLEALLTISRSLISEELSLISEVDSKNLFDRVSSSRLGSSSNTDVLDLPCLLVLIYGSSKAERRTAYFLLLECSLGDPSEFWLDL
ncbi:hypothetical protein Tco_1284580 [Tanacetum coccineum]